VKLSLVGPVDDSSGYGITVNQIATRLPALLGADIVIRPTRPCHVATDLQAMVQPGENDAEWELIVHPPTLALTPGKKTIYVTMGESTRLPARAVKLLNQCHAVIVPSAFCATSFSASGVNAPIFTVPLGFDPAVFRYTPLPSGPFTFACAGRLRNGPTRKGVAEVIRLFQAAFPNGEEVRLKVKVFPNDPPLVTSDKRIEISRAVWSAQELADWMASAHCFVNLATGGFELFPLQAMALGRPVISFAFGGITEFFNSKNGFLVEHNLTPASDVWKGHGLFAEARRWSAIAAMRDASRQPEICESVGMFAFLSTRHLTWENSIKRLAEVLEPLKQPKPIVTPMSVSHPDTLTIGITNFKRARHLERAIQSAKPFPTVVSAMEPDGAVENVLHAHDVTAVRNIDLGCHASWERAAYYADSEYVLILHDDDVLKPEFAQAWTETILPALKRGLAVTWRSEHLWDDGRIVATEYHHGPTRELPQHDLIELLCRSQLSLSPIVTVFRRAVLIEALKEGAEYLTHPDCQHHQGMKLGTEVLCHLRHAQASSGWLYLDEVLSQYGVHEGSGTVQAERSGELGPLIRGYDLTRAHWLTHPVPPKTAPRIIAVFSDYAPKDDGERTRFDQAWRTWQFHIDQGEVMPFPVRDDALPRCEDVPYVRDLFDYGCRFAAENDIVVLLNRDVCLTTQAVEHMRHGMAQTGGLIACPRRDMNPIVTGRLYRTVRNCKPDGGYDVFAVTPGWWRANREAFPDMFLGREAWDTVLRRMGEEQFGDKVYVDDVCYHRAHLSRWQQDRTKLPSQIHNRKVALEFFKERNDPWMIKQLS
jgi:hypothetical protein